MDILVVGSGGREHAICYSLAKSDKVDKIYCAPGNAGISEIAECVNINVMDAKGIIAFLDKNKNNRHPAFTRYLLSCLALRLTMQYSLPA